MEESTTLESLSALASGRYGGLARPPLLRRRGLEEEAEEYSRLPKSIRLLSVRAKYRANSGSPMVDFIRTNSSIIAITFISSSVGDDDGSSK